MSIKHRKIILTILLLALLTIVGVFVILRDTGTTTSLKVLDYGYSVCTMDVPSSSCGAYDVTVESTDGQKATYKVVGFDNRDSELYDTITSKISEAKEHHTTVKLEVNNKGEIISAQ